MNKADGFSINRLTNNNSTPPSQSGSDQEQSSFWNNFSTAVKNTAQYASVEFDRLFETMGFKQSPSTSLAEEQQQQQRSMDTNTTLPTTISISSPSRRQSSTSRYFSTPSFSSTSQQQHKSSRKSSISSSTSSLAAVATNDRRKRPFRHDNDDTLDHMTFERAEKLRRINEVEAMLRELKEEALMDNYNAFPTTSTSTATSNGTHTNSNNNNTTTSSARNIATRTIEKQAPKVTATITTPSMSTSVDGYRHHRDEQGRMQALEHRIEAIQAQVAKLVSSTSIASTTSSSPTSTSPSSTPSRPSTITAPVRPLKTTPLVTPTHIPVPPPAPTPLQHQIHMSPSRAAPPKVNDGAEDRKNEPEIPLPSPPPLLSTQSPIRHQRISTNSNSTTFTKPTTSSSTTSPLRANQIPAGGYKVLPSTPAVRTSRATTALNKVPSDIHRSSMKEIVQQIPNVKLRRTDILEGPDGSMKPNPFWVEIYEPKRRYKRPRLSTDRDSNQQQNGTIGSGPASKRQRA
ncbi:hypothetical protein BDA99DRAFT_521872 [Phascolomyces articulosus]|uniref:Uncharacterized protein n=1 Tax=Phascolomyces articulosus TaxID=60185 RepID=A0AAD5K2P7_9FUNG|nr:hypothetical protein BDA99DRAFT_521872 [Phascolomyces articulosus]